MADNRDAAARLAEASLEELRRQWRRFYRTEPSIRLSRDLLLRAVAFKLQEQRLGGLSATAQRRLRELAQRLDAEGGRILGLPNPIKPGARLVRAWRGRSHMVTVLDQGFDYDGHRYRSLTEIAKVITGGHCSGPRFFGLRAPGQKANHEQA